MGPGLPLLPVYLKQGKITSLYLGGERSPILMIFRSTVFCPMIHLLALGAMCLWRVSFSLYWHGLLSLLGRTLPAKMAHLATRETLFICRIVSIRINPFSHSLGEAPLRGRSMLCLLCVSLLQKLLCFRKLFIFLSLRQCSRRLWGQSGELLGPGRRKRRWQGSP